MHEENKVNDGFFEIVQEIATNRVFLKKYGTVVRVIQPGRLLSLDELHDMLIRERTEIFVEGV